MTKNQIVAREMLAFARELISLEFDTKKEMDDYKREHDVRPGTEMEVKPEAKKEPAKEEPKKEHSKFDAGKADVKKNEVQRNIDELVRMHDEGGQSGAVTSLLVSVLKGSLSQMDLGLLKKAL